MESQGFEVLVIDDDQPTYDLLVRIGNELFPQARFVWQASYDQTVRYLDDKSTNPPQIVLLDIDLRQAVDGLDLLPQLRDRFKGKTPVVMLTVSESSDKINRAYERGAIAFTKKPDNLQGWRNYMSLLKAYWYETTLLPRTTPPPTHLLNKL
ncbi:response regulator [Larkinella insperata]|uniref:Response regulator n=1 Tax=Larkinella insperata TaxID=332158 RepID=A0ABW3QAZ1_9BACT|nr:response regulator [Larkinella insperata]